MARSALVNNGVVSAASAPTSSAIGAAGRVAGNGSSTLWAILRLRNECGGRDGLGFGKGLFQRSLGRVFEGVSGIGYAPCAAMRRANDTDCSIRVLARRVESLVIGI